MFRKSFKSKIILPVVAVLAVLAIIISAYVSLEFLYYSDAFINDKIEANVGSLIFHVENDKENSKAAAISMARDPDAVKAIKNRDREEILRIFAPKCDLYRINYFTVTDEKGSVLARTHDPDHFDDSVLNQKNIEDAINGKVSTYFESGTVVKVSVRTGAPVYDADGTMVGIISAGIRFDTNETVDELKKEFHADVTVYYGDTRIATTVTKNGRRIIGTKIDPVIAKIVIEDKQKYVGEADTFSMRFKTYYMPLINANDDVFAVLCVETPMQSLKKEAEGLIRNVIMITFAATIVAIILLYLIVSSITKPLIALSHEMDNIKAGNLNVVIEAKREDEIGHVGKSLQMVVDTLRKLMNEIDVTIAEHDKGNMEHRLDPDAFHGHYRLLTERIMELSNLGMRDQLTGLPNRRSFDRRLEMEWNRTMREKAPLSILMLDIDKFKTYNDTYGHQQGDATLQTVAKSIAKIIKRSFDFAARWGGEEFAVLLPNTDSNGAMHVAEMIRKEIENVEIPCINGGVVKKVTVSIGINTQVPTLEKSTKNLISQADEALYRAKTEGRNRVCLYSSDPTTPVGSERDNAS